MAENLNRVKDYLLDLGLTIVAENEAEELVVVYMMQSVGMRNRYRMRLRALVGQAIID